jgi:hypothetical protein
MKTRFANSPRARRSCGGSAVVAMVALLAVMVILIAANTASLNRLTREVKGLEKQQIQRLATTAKALSPPSQTATNQPSAR